LSLRLLIDEDSQAQRLVNLLRNAGHDVITVNEAGLMSKPDTVVLNYAIQQERLLLTRNCNDFLALHKTNPNHPGILAVYQDPDPSKNMSYLSIVKSIANLETSSYSVANQFISLNQWNYSIPI
jgi:predicted nuclease of predicted toxin-antitoxin system